MSYLQYHQCVTILYLHGNAGSMYTCSEDGALIVPIGALTGGIVVHLDIGHTLPHVKGLVDLCGFNVMLLEYRGYGKSEGSPSEAGFHLDATAALEYLARSPGVDASKIAVFGCSLGGAVAVNLLASPGHKHCALALMMENTFTR